MTSLPEERFILMGENPNQWIEKGLYFFSWEKTRKKAQAIWFKNTLLLPQRVKSNSDQGFALLSSREEPCPLSLSHGFFTIQPSPSVSTRIGLFFPLFSVPEKVACPPFF